MFRKGVGLLGPLALVVASLLAGAGGERPVLAQAGSSAAAVKAKATPTPGLPFQGQPSVQSGDIAVIKMDVIQTVSQPPFDDEPSVALIARKEALVRVWVLVDAPVDRLVLVRLEANHNGTPMGSCGPGTTQATRLIDNAVDDGNVENFTHSNLSRTVNFHLPANCAWLDPGFLQLTATVEGTECADCDWNNTTTAIYPLHEQRQLRLRLSLITYYLPNSPNHGKTAPLTLDGFAYLISAFPINSIDFMGLDSWTSDPPNDEMNAISLENPAAADWWDRYVAMRDLFAYTHYDAYYGQDSHLGLLHQDIVGCAGVAGLGVALTGEGCGGTYAHEIGHNFGLPHASNSHAECAGGDCDPEWPLPHGGRNGNGWNSLAPDKLTVPSFSNGTHSHDFMSYGTCAASAPTYNGELATYCTSWPSLLNYGRIAQRMYCADPQASLDFYDPVQAACYQEWGPFADLLTVPTPELTPEGPDPVAPIGDPVFQGTPPGSSGQAPGVIRLVGRFGADGSVKWWPAYVGRGVGRLAADRGDGGYELLLLDVNGVVLSRRTFDPHPTFIHARGRHLGFDETLPWHPATHRLALARNGLVLGERTLSAHAPTVRLLSPNGNETWPADGTITVAWEGSDLDGDVLSYWLEYSPDGGRTWETIVSNITGSRHTLQAWDVPGGDRALVRVRATDGVRSSADVSDATFAALKKAPVVKILGAAGPLELVSGRYVELRGLGIDPDGGTVRGAGLTWTSDRDGLLGSGDQLRIERLSRGTHRVKLTGRDRDGQSATDEVTVIVHSAVPVS
jgi:hypothetical protein